jgi:hypothetical protein
LRTPLGDWHLADWVGSAFNPDAVTEGER